jgi:hypothetical protein
MEKPTRHITAIRTIAVSVKDTAIRLIFEKIPSSEPVPKLQFLEQAQLPSSKCLF